jgi:hypothetical protein
MVCFFFLSFLDSLVDRAAPSDGKSLVSFFARLGNSLSLVTGAAIGPAAAGMRRLICVALMNGVVQMRKGMIRT